MKNIDEFKAFVKSHPLLKQEVLAKRKTWQELYEEYTLLGEENFKEYEKKEEVKEELKETKKDNSTEDLIKTIVRYVKKIDPDQITKTVTSIQKVLELIGAIGGGSIGVEAAKKSTLDPLFDKRFDEWY